MHFIELNAELAAAWKTRFLANGALPDADRWGKFEGKLDLLERQPDMQSS